MPYKKLLIAALSAGLALSSATSLATDNITPSQSKKILAALQTQSTESFTTFLQQSNKHAPEQTQTSIQAYLNEAPLSQSQSQQIARLLGLYAQAKYGQQAIESLRQLVAIPTFKTEGIPSHQSPAMKELGIVVKDLAAKFGLSFQNIDDRVFVIDFPGNKAGKQIALHAHADVVPVNPESWVLEDGTKLDPFKLTFINDRMYGRGAEDDKNGIIVAMYAMRVIKEEGLSLFNNFKLLIDTTEESGSDAIPYYLERHPTPDFNLALDGGYPVVIAEKGYGTLMANFPVRSTNAPYIEQITGGLATNQIPNKSVITIQGGNNDLASKLQQQADNFVKQQGGDFSIKTVQNGDQLAVTVTGVSAHSSSPESGINPVSRALLFIHQSQKSLGINSNHITDAAHYAAENFGLDYLGNQFGAAYAHDFMGPLTMALTFIDINDQQMRLAVNLRAPVGKEMNALKQDVKSKLDSWLQESGINMTYSHAQRSPMYRNPEGKWVNALLDVATQNLGLPRKFESSAGATSIHDLPNGVQFGLSMPNEKYTGHNANEFKRVEQFMLDLRIVTEMMHRLGNMKEL